MKGKKAHLKVVLEATEGVDPQASRWDVGARRKTTRVQKSLDDRF